MELGTKVFIKSLEKFGVVVECTQFPYGQVPGNWPFVKIDNYNHPFRSAEFFDPNDLVVLEEEVTENERDKKLKLSMLKVSLSYPGAEPELEFLHSEIRLRQEEILTLRALCQNQLKELRRLAKENETLRQYGNKDCTAQADEAMRK